MKNQLYTLLLSLLALGFAPTIYAQIPGDCGGPPADIPPAESCLEACVYCDFMGTQGSTLGYAANTAPSGFCGTIQNDQWIGFVAGEVGAIFTLTPSNCLNGNGLEFALYENCTSPPLVCAAGQVGGGSTPLTLTVNNMVVGRHYYLLIDGYEGDTCEYTITVGPPMACVVKPMASISPIQGPAVVCPGANATYEVQPVLYGGFYTWRSTTPGVLFNGKASPADILAPEGTKVQVTFPSNISGLIQMCVRANNACNQGPMVCRTVNVQPIPPTNFPKVVVCNEDAPYPLPWGGMASTLGTNLYKTVLKSWLGCDSVVQQQVNIKPPITTNLGNKYICVGDSIKVCGQAFKEQGPITMTCQSFQGCDSLVTGYLFTLKPLFQASPPKPMLSCNKPEITLSATPLSGMGVVIWRNAQGQVIGTGTMLKVSKSGTYTAINTVNLGGVVCVYQKEFVVQENFTQPAPIKTMKSGSLAGGGSVQLKAFSPTPDLLYQWIGPQGFISIQQNPNVTVPGLYKVTAMHKLSGCTAMATITVGP